MSDSLYTALSSVTGFEQLEDTPLHVNTNALLISGHLGTSTNATINGNITVTGTVDGRDVAADGITTDNNFTTLNSNSARYDRTALSLETNVVPNSARWNTNANTELAAISARYTRTANSLETNVVPNTANWTTAYNRHEYGNVQVSGNSVDWDGTPDIGINPFQVIAGDAEETLVLSGTDSVSLLVSRSTRTIAFSANSSDTVFNSSEIAAASARYSRTATSLETNVVPKSARWERTATSLETNVVPNTADWNYVATNSAEHANESSFKTISLTAVGTSMQYPGDARYQDVVADSATDTLTLCAGPNIEITSNPNNDTLLISSVNTNTIPDGFKTIALSSVNAKAALGADVVADSSTDTLTLCAGPNILLLSNPATDTIMISGSEGGSHFNSSLIAAASGSWNSTNTTLKTISTYKAFNTITLQADGGEVNSYGSTAQLSASTFQDNLNLIAGENIYFARTDTDDLIISAQNDGIRSTKSIRLTGDGTSKHFEVSARITDHHLAFVTLGGVVQEPTTHYTVSGAANHITNADVKDLNFTAAPADGEKIEVRVFQDGLADTLYTVNNTVYSGATVTSTSNLTGDGTTKHFEVSARLSDAAMAIVTVGGIVQIPTVQYTTSAAAAHPTNADVADLNFILPPLSGEMIEVRGFHDGTVLNETTILNTFTTVNNNSAVWNLRVLELDGSPSTLPITAIKVPNDTLTTSNKTATLDYMLPTRFPEVIASSGSWNSTNTTVKDGSARWNRTATSLETNVVPKSARWERTATSLETNVVTNTAKWNSNYSTVNTYSADWTWVAENSGGAITVKESDGSPNVSNVTTIVVSNGTLTDNSNGQVTIDTGGSGGGGGTTSPFTSGSGKFYSTNGGDKVGLGTSTPQTKLDITDSSGTFIQLSGKGNSAEAGLHIRTDARGAFTMYMENSGEGADDQLQFNCGPLGNDSVAMMLSSVPEVDYSGLLDINHIYARTKIGIGTAKPADPLTVIGNISSTGQVSTHTVAGVGTGDLTLDSGGDIVLDADGADVILKDDGTEFGRFKRDSSNFVIKSATNNKDIIFKGQDGGSTITAMTIDMSEGGKVGIGTSVPQTKLDITDSSSAFIHLSGSGNSAEAGVHFRTDARGDFLIYMENSSEGEDDQLQFNCGPLGNNSVAMMLSSIPEVDHSGFLDINHIYARTKIGVGTAKPGEALSVIGNISASGDITAANTSYKFANGEFWSAANVTDIKANSGSGGGSSEWTDTGSVLHPADSSGTADAVVIGGTTVSGSDIVFNTDGSAVFNEQSGNVDFRVESNGDTHALFVDGSADDVGIGTSVPTEKLTVKGNVSGSGKLFFNSIDAGSTFLAISADSSPNTGYTVKLTSDDGDNHIRYDYPHDNSKYWLAGADASSGEYINSYIIWNSELSDPPVVYIKPNSRTVAINGSLSASGDLICGNTSLKFHNGEFLTSGNVTDLKAASGGQVSVTNLGTDNTPTINFAANRLQYVAINGNCTFQNATNISAGKTVTCLITNGGTARTLAFPSDWVFIGAKPTAIAASKNALLQLIVYTGSSQSNVICPYNTQD